MKATRTTARASPSVPTRFFFFGGKGGVGKTTMAAARAVQAARSGVRVLVVSTDPAHSLGDVLGVTLSSRPRLVKLPPGPANGGLLHAAEIDAPRAFTRWVNAHRQTLIDVVEHGTWLDREDAGELLGLPIPGVDELMGLLEIVQLAGGPGRRAPYDLVVIDTAPTGHALRLLSAPAAVAGVANVLDALQEEHRAVRRQIARIVRPEAADRLIALLATQADEIGSLLRDRRRTAFEWVTLPEEMSVAESEDALAALRAFRITVSAVIVNRVTPAGSPCAICNRRRAHERAAIASARRRLARGRPLRIVAAAFREPRGVKALARIGATGAEKAGSKTAAIRAASAPEPRGSFAIGDLAAFRGARLLFFGGKGGVGKTTTAAAVAVTLARLAPDRRVLLLSTDPAHSLADVFGSPIGDRPVRVRFAPANLHAWELDAARALAARRSQLEAAFAEITAAFGAGGVRVGSTESGVSELMDLAPPGIDELFGILSVAELLSAKGGYGLIVVDTAPTGHALRLLEMPDAARNWLQVLLRVLLKYRSLVRPGELAAGLVEMSKAVRELHALLRDPQQARFIVVTRAAEVPGVETRRLLDRLGQLGLSVPLVIANAMTVGARSLCPRCRATAAAERAALAPLVRRCARRSGDCVIIQTPLAAPPPHGAAALDAWAAQWRLLAGP